MLKKYSVCGPFKKHKQRIQKSIATEDLKNIYKNELDKACFQHDMAYNKYNDLEKRTQSGTLLKNKAFKIASDPRYDGYERSLASMIYRFFDKKSSKNSSKEAGISMELANEPHKPIIKKFF